MLTNLLLLSASVFAATATQAAAEPSSASLACTPVEVPGIGPACPAGNGLYDVYGADGESLGTTHGGHPVAGPHDDEPSIAEGLRNPKCVADPSSDYYALVIYARADDDADQYTTLTSQIRDLVAESNAFLYDAAKKHGESRDIKVHCTNGEITVKNVVLPTNRADASFATIVSDLRAKGYTSTSVKYWVFYDDGSLCTCSGSAHVYYDDSLTVNNKNNGNPYVKSMFAVMYGSLNMRAFLHELSHTLGAVQHSAPHSTDAGHCNDGRDVMCYNDGGPSAAYTSGACSTQQYDCNSDDYFHPEPPASSWLSSHWNIGSTLNRFLDATGGSAPPPTPTQTPTPTPPNNDAPGMPTLSCSPNPSFAEDNVTCSVRAADDSAGIRYRLTWGDGTTTYVPANGFVSPGTTRTATHAWSGVGSFTVTVRATDVEGATGAGRAVTQTVETRCDALFTDRLVIGLSGTMIDGVSSATHDVPSACQGGAFTLDATPALHDFNVCWVDRWGSTIGCHTVLGTDTGDVPAAATYARVVYFLGADGEYRLRLSNQ